MGTENKKEVAKTCRKTKITHMLFDARIKDLPKGFYASISIGDYYMYVHVMHTMPPVVYVEKKEGCGRTTTVKFSDPNPDVAVGELFRRAKELIEASVNCPGR